MSILVKGMKMPKNCRKCTFFNYRRILGEPVVYCDVIDREFEADEEEEMENKRLDDCPFVELPERHGRLIDEKGLKETLDYYIKEAGWGEKHNEALKWVKDEFIDAEPTVIEAEGEE